MYSDNATKSNGSFSICSAMDSGNGHNSQALYAIIKGPRSQILTWSEDGIKTFEQLKNHVASAPVLHLPDMTKPFVLVTDASDVGTGAMLAQKQAGGQLAPVAFSNHSLSRAEQNYTVTDRKMLAVVLAVKKFRVYLSTQPLVLMTDHVALKWLNSLAVDEARCRRARWIEYLQQFQMNPIHRPGTRWSQKMTELNDYPLCSLWRRSGKRRKSVRLLAQCWSH